MHSSDFDYLETFYGIYSIGYKVRRKKNSESEQDDEILALKRQLIHGWPERFAVNEEKIIKKLKHPNIIGFYGSWLEDGKLNLLFEFASGGSLCDYLNNCFFECEPMTETESLYFFSQLLLGVDYLHSKDILHRDLSPENVMFVGPLQRVKIADFNISRNLSSGEEHDKIEIYSISYTPNEVLGSEDCTFGSDVWSIGAMLYEVATGRDPFNIKGNVESALEVENLPLAIKTICTSTCQKDPNDRPSTSELIRYPELKSHICEYYDSLDIPEKKFVVEQLKDIIEDETTNSVE